MSQPMCAYELIVNYIIQDEKNEIFGAIMDLEHATPLMMKGGKLDQPVSLGHFLKDVPFYCLYDDVICERPITVEEKAMNEPPVEVVEAESLGQSLWNAANSMW